MRRFTIMAACSRAAIASRAAALTVVLATLALGLGALRAPSAEAAFISSSSQVLVVQGGGHESTPVLPTAGSVEGAPEDSFERFSFAEIGQKKSNRRNSPAMTRSSSTRSSPTSSAAPRSRRSRAS